MALGALLVLAAAGLFGWNRWEDYQAGKALEETLPRVKDLISGEDPDKDPEGTGENGEGESPAAGGMAAGWVDGFPYVGYVSLPTLGLELPVMDSWSYYRLRIAPCRYTGSVESGDLVIAAHNYTTHFGRLKYLSEGDPVFFTDMEGEQTAYEVSLVDTLSPYAVEEMTGSGYALTLFTCTYSGQGRVTVRCSPAPPGGGAGAPGEITG